MSDSPGGLLREAVDESTIQVPGAPNALIARLIERMGFDAVLLSNEAVATGELMLPDIDLVTLNELTQRAIQWTRTVSMPVIVDAGAGYSSAAQVERAVYELEFAGAAAVQFNDRQFLPDGQTLESAGTVCSKLSAAASARCDADLVIIARTDARRTQDTEVAIERARLYLEAGADWILAEGLQSADEFEQVSRAVDAPLVASMNEFGDSPLLTLDELANLGYAMVLYPMTVLRVAMRAAEAALATLADEGTQKGLLDLMQTPDEILDLLCGTAEPE